MSTIRSRNGKYQCIVRIAGYPTITKTFDVKKDAEVFGKDLELKLIREEYDLEKKTFTTFEEVFERYRDEIVIHKKFQPEKLRRLNDFYNRQKRI